MVNSLASTCKSAQGSGVVVVVAVVVGRPSSLGAVGVCNSVVCAAAVLKAAAPPFGFVVRRLAPL